MRILFVRMYQICMLPSAILTQLTQLTPQVLLLIVPANVHPNLVPALSRGSSSDAWLLVCGEPGWPRVGPLTAVHVPGTWYAVARGYSTVIVCVSRLPCLVDKEDACATAILVVFYDQVKIDTRHIFDTIVDVIRAPA